MKKLIVLLLSALSFVSCDNYLDLGDNPNNLHTDVAKPDQYLSAAQTSSYSLQASTKQRLGLLFSNACGGNVQSFASPFNDEFNFNVTTTFYSSIFTSTYLVTNSYQKIIDYNDTNLEYTNFKAIAKIGKVYNMQYIVDLYGDAPYTEMFKGLNNVTPKYDDDFFIYQQLFKELDEARTLIDDVTAGTYPNTLSASTTDFIFGGDLSKWKLFANSIELKMLVRMSKCTGAAGNYRDTRLSNLVSTSNNNFINEDVTINPGYSTARTDSVNPQFSTFLCDNLGNPTGFTVYTPSGYIVKCLNTYANVTYNTPADKEIVSGKGVFYPNVADPRRSSLFSGNPQRGVTQGSTVVDAIKPGASPNSQPSRFAGGFFNLYNNTGYGGTITPGGNGISQADCDAYGASKGFIMTKAEVLFLQAEAAHLATQIAGYAVLGLNAQTCFTNAIDASMDQYQITSSSKSTYINQISNTTNPNLKNFWYNAGSTFDEKYNAIMYQKWISILPSNAIESYLDLTRTGFPINPLPLGNSYSQRPNRLIYPISEYIANSANVPNVTIGDLFSVSSKSPFWLQ